MINFSDDRVRSMQRCTRMTVLAVLLIFPFKDIYGQSPVKMEEKNLVIPTYQIAPPDVDPVFYTGRIYQGAKGEVYPYPMYAALTDVKKDQAYKAVFIENQYTQLCVMPQLGGKIFRALDKTNGYDFFYHQHVIKPSLIGMLGAWISGGVEWDVPDHHRASSFLPVDYSLQENPDGSKTVWVGENVLSRRLRWIVGLTLYPGKTYVEATVRIFNPSSFAQPFLYWANSAVHVDSSYQVIFPPDVQFGVFHAKVEFTRWPVGSGMYNGADRTGVDQSWWKNSPKPNSIFAWHARGDFLAGYDHDKDAGTVEVANHHIVEGKKFWEWGSGSEGKMWRRVLTDSDGPYIELMTGAYSDNQPDYSWIAPGGTKVFHQYFYPVKGIGGVKNANKDAAVNLSRVSPRTIRVGLNTTSPFKRARVVIWIAGKQYKQETVNISPEDPFKRSFSINPSVRDTDIRVALIDRQGREVISYQPAELTKKEMPVPVEAPKPPAAYKTNQELYLTGLRLEQFRNGAIDPLPYYKEALRRDSLDYLVNNRLGVDYCLQGRFKDAERCFRRALKRLMKNYTTPKDGEAFYYLGVALQFQHRYKEALDAFWKATWYNRFKHTAYLHLAQLACLDHNFDEALPLINRSIAFNTSDPSSRVLKAYILRKQEKLKKAAAVLEAARKSDELNYWGGIESCFNRAGGSGRSPWSDMEAAGFKKVTRGDVQAVLQIALEYGNVGAYDEAIQVLDHFKRSGFERSGFPLLFYYSGFYRLKKGERAAAKADFEKGAHAPYAYCFPFRLEEIEILDAAVKTNPRDAKARYYLGNLLYYRKQSQAAIAQWQHAAGLDDKFYLSFRNLGFAYNQVDHDYPKAIQAYQKAIALNPQNPRLFAEVDAVREATGMPPAKRLSLLEKHLPAIKKRDAAMIRVVALYNLTGNYDKALKVLTTRDFHVWEGAEDEIRNVFVNTNLLKGISEMREKQYSRALEDFKRALTHPRNLEVGRPYNGGRSAQVNYYIGLALSRSGNKAAAAEYFDKAAQAFHPQALSALSFYTAMAFRKLGKEKDAAGILNELLIYAQKQLSAANTANAYSKFGSGTSGSLRLAGEHYLLGLAYYGKEDLAMAEEQFKKAAELDPTHVWARVMLNAKIE